MAERRKIPQRTGECDNVLTTFGVAELIYLVCIHRMSTPFNLSNEPTNNKQIAAKERKKHDRFNGMTEEEVSKRTLPDHLADNLDIIIVSVIFSFSYHSTSVSHATYNSYICCCN